VTRGVTCPLLLHTRLTLAANVPTCCVEFVARLSRDFDGRPVAVGARELELAMRGVPIGFGAALCAVFPSCRSAQVRRSAEAARWAARQDPLPTGVPYLPTYRGALPPYLPQRTNSNKRNIYLQRCPTYSFSPVGRSAAALK